MKIDPPALVQKPVVPAMAIRQIPAGVSGERQKRKDVSGASLKKLEEEYEAKLEEREDDFRKRLRDAHVMALRGGEEVCFELMVESAKVMIDRADRLVRSGAVRGEKNRLRVPEIRKKVILAYDEAVRSTRLHLPDIAEKVAFSVALAGAYEGFIRWCQ